MRQSIDQYYVAMATLVSTRATCIRRSVGCVLVNKRMHVLSTGYNGRASGQKHCNDAQGSDVLDVHGDARYPFACPGMDNVISGQSLDRCEAIHAEQNALLQCRDVQQIYICYVTHSPCITCTKLLMNTSCQRIVFNMQYAHDYQSRKLWTDCGREWVEVAHM